MELDYKHLNLKYINMYEREFNNDIWNRAGYIPSSWFDWHKTTGLIGCDTHAQMEDLDKHIELAGVAKKDCQVTYDNEYIVIEATDYQENKINQKIYVGNLDTNTLNAELKNGILSLTGKLKDSKVNVKIS